MQIQGLRWAAITAVQKRRRGIVARRIRVVVLRKFHQGVDRQARKLAGLDDEGAQNWARLASLIATCKLNGIEPFAYMKATIEALVAGHRNAEIDQLLPWNFRVLRAAAAT